MNKEAIINSLKHAIVSSKFLSKREMAKLTAQPSESLDVLVRQIPDNVLEAIKKHTEYSNLVCACMLYFMLDVKIVITQVKTLRRAMQVDVIKPTTKSAFSSELWCTSVGGKLKPADMATNHLFCTIRLLWNSFMPRPLSVGTYKAVWFNPKTYTSDYLTTIIKLLYAELQTRTDLHSIHQEQLNDMQLNNLLAQVATQELVETAVAQYEEREDKEYDKDVTYSASSWDSKEGIDFS